MRRETAACSTGWRRKPFSARSHREHLPSTWPICKSTISMPQSTPALRASWERLLPPPSCAILGMLWMAPISRSASTQPSTPPSRHWSRTSSATDCRGFPLSGLATCSDDATSCFSSKSLPHCHFLLPPSPVNLHRIKRVAKQRAKERRLKKLIGAATTVAWLGCGWLTNRI